jgi:hypothetical protein
MNEQYEQFLSGVNVDLLCESSSTNKKLVMKKKDLVKAPQDDFHKKRNITAFQLIDFEIDYFGKKEKFTLDTKILKNGKQFVIGGNGYIPDGYEIK